MKSLDKIEQIKAMRKNGASLKDIATTLEVSMYAAYSHSRAETPLSQRHTPQTCSHGYKGLSCQRFPTHRGIHLSAERGRLIYWD